LPSDFLDPVQLGGLGTTGRPLHGWFAGAYAVQPGDIASLFVVLLDGCGRYKIDRIHRFGTSA
jgi:hypothetical protein